jgi:hypothetical protein
MQTISVGKPEMKRPLRRPLSIWVVNIGIDLKKTGWESVHWLHLDQDRGK